MFSFWFVFLALVVCCQIASFLFAASSKWSWRPIWSWSDHTKVQKGPVHQGITFSSSTMIHVFQSICFGCKQTKLNFRRSGSSWQRTTWVTLSSASAQTTTLLNRPPRPALTGSLPFTITAEPTMTQLLCRYLLEQSNGVGPSYFPGPGNRVFETQYQVLFKIFSHFGFEDHYQFLSFPCFQLPKDLTCVQCVFQWRYIAANNWGEFFSSWWCSLWGSPYIVAWDYVLQI